MRQKRDVLPLDLFSSNACFHSFLAFYNPGLVCACIPAMLITSNKSFFDWGEVFRDPVLNPCISGYSALARMDHRKTASLQPVPSAPRNSTQVEPMQPSNEIKQKKRSNQRKKETPGISFLLFQKQVSRLRRLGLYEREN
jgi:hypothetical protein